MGTFVQYYMFPFAKLGDRIEQKEGDGMTKAYEQRKESNKRYLKTLDEIRIRIPKGKKEEYKKKAATQGKSLNQFIIDCIEKGLE